MARLFASWPRRTPMKTAHADSPTICAQCIAVVHSRIPSGTCSCNLIYPCRHQPGGVIVATVFVVDGTIHEWMLSGPMSEERATAMLQQFLKANRAAGGHIEEFRAHGSSR